MTTKEESPYDSKALIETSIRIALIAIMAVVTVRIVMPFLIPVAWGVIIAVAVNPFITKIGDKLGGRKKLASILFALIIIAALIIPSVFLIASSIESVHPVADALESGTLVIPEPPSSVAQWPLVGEQLYTIWQQAHTNLSAVLTTYGPQLREIAVILLGSSTGGSDSASSDFYVRIAQILFAGLFTVLGLVVVEHLLRPRKKKSSAMRIA